MANIRPVRDLYKISVIEKINRMQGHHKIYGFLDFDGVINLYNFDISDDEVVKQKARDNDFFDRDCMDRLNALCLKYDIHLVISSSWRYYGLQYCKDYLIGAGLDPDIDICGVTIIDYASHRPQQIIDYLLEHRDYTGYIVFDDMNMVQLGERLVHCDTQKGLDESCVKYAQKILDKMQ